MNTIQNSANAKNAILAFIRNLVSKSMYVAIKNILNPCCTLSGSATVSCVSSGVYDIAVTTNQSIGFLGNGQFEVQVDGKFFLGDIVEPNSISVTDAEVTAGTQDIVVVVYLPTNTEKTIGVFKSFTIQDVVFTSC